MLDIENSQKIIQYLKEKGQATTAQLAAYLGISTQAVHKQLTKLIESGQVVKTGTHPNIAYRLAEPMQAKIQAASGVIATPTAKAVPTSSSSVMAGNPQDKGGQLNSTVPLSSQTQPTKEDILRTADDLAFRTLSWQMYNQARLFIENIWFVRLLLKNKVISRPLIIVGIIGLMTWMGLQYWWIPSRQNQLAPTVPSELTQTRQELSEAKQQLADSQNEFKTQLALAKTQAQDQQKNFEDQLKALQQQVDKGGQLNSTQNKGGQSNSTVPISSEATYIPVNQIVAWSNQGVSSTEIINRIKTSHSAYWFGDNDPAWFRQQGVSEEVIQFMAKSGPLRDKGGQLNSTVPISKKILGWIQGKINGE